jgi:hypothetical protein
VSTRQRLPWIVALAVVIGTALVVLALPNGHHCRGNNHPAREVEGGFAGGHTISFWVCVSNYQMCRPLWPLAQADHRTAFRLGLALDGVALALALGFVVHTAFPVARRASAEASVSP